MKTLLWGSLLCLGACNSVEVVKRSSVLDYLYPEGTPAVPATDVQLTLPLRVGVAFAPGESRLDGGDGRLSDVKKQQLLGRIVAAFQDHDAIGSVTPVPTLYLKSGGGFANLEQLAATFGLDIMVLLSFDQAQFSETSNWGLTYWTIVGAYVVEGENNQTHTFLDAAVFDIRSHALLFRAAGTDIRGDSATPAELQDVMRQQSEAGFSNATDDLVVQLGEALAAFSAQAATGTVRGLGTPAIEIRPSVEYSGVAQFENGHYVGTVDGAPWILMGLLVVGGWMARRHA